VGALSSQARRSARRVAASCVQRLCHRADVLGNLGEEAQFAQHRGRTRAVARDLEKRSEVPLATARLGTYVRDDAVERVGVACLCRLGGTLAALELRLEEVEWQPGVGLVECIDATQVQEVAAALDRVLQRAIGLVDTRRSLQREPARRVVGGGVAIRTFSMMMSRSSGKLAME